MQRLDKLVSDVWHHVVSLAAIECPFYTNCDRRRRGLWCPNDTGKVVREILDSNEVVPDMYYLIPCGPACWVFEEVEKLTLKLLHLTGIAEPPLPLTILNLIDKQYGVEVRSLPLKLCHGGVWWRGGKWVIQLNSNDPETVKRYTLFHEAFHILCRNKAHPQIDGNGFRKNCFNELLAESFAGYLLMPKKWIRELWPSINSLEEMSRIFDVHPSAMYVTLRRLCLI